MQLDTFNRLLASEGQAVLQAAESMQPQEASFLASFQQLSRNYEAELSRAALETAILRREARVKFPFADKLYFTREALEQASAWEVAAYRMGRYRPFELTADLGCSIGGDTLALASQGRVIGVDLDPLRLSMAQANLFSMGLLHQAHLVQADLRSPLPLGRRRDGLALFFDPARRAAGKRLHSVRQYQPPLELVREWQIWTPALGVKVSPGVELGELRGYPAEVEFISLNRELKEGALWFGPLKSAERRATVLPGPHTLVASAAAPLEIREPQAYIYEPDPSVLRAGLVAELGLRLDASQLDADIAYLTGSQRLQTPFARSWVVADWFPFGLKRLRAYLRQRGVGRVTVKKRGSPLQPEKLIQDLRLSGEAERTLFLTHLRGEPVVVVALTGEEG